MYSTMRTRPHCVGFYPHYNGASRCHSYFFLGVNSCWAEFGCICDKLNRHSLAAGLIHDVETEEIKCTGSYIQNEFNGMNVC